MRGASEGRTFGQFEGSNLGKPTGDGGLQKQTLRLEYGSWVAGWGDVLDSPPAPGVAPGWPNMWDLGPMVSIYNCRTRELLEGEGRLHAAARLVRAVEP